MKWEMEIRSKLCRSSSDQQSINYPIVIESLSSFTATFDTDTRRCSQQVVDHQSLKRALKPNTAGPEYRSSPSSEDGTVPILR